MSELAIADPLSPANVERFHHELAKFDPVELVTEHFFADGMYCRKCYLPIGTIFVGKVQAKEHLFMVVKGALVVSHDGKLAEYEEGAVFVSPPGSKRIGITYDDTIVVTVHRTDKTDLDEIEREVITPSGGPCFYDARNKLVVPRLADKGVEQ